LPEPGFARTAAASLRGMVLSEVKSRRGDRLLCLTFAARSRFGVDDRLELFLELVPRFGNLVLVKRDVVVAAAKEFTPAQNSRRAVQAGQPYEPPPLPPRNLQIPKLLAAHGATDQSILALAEDDTVLSDPLHVYRAANGTLLQAHVVALGGFANAAHTREAAILAVFSELRRQLAGRGELERSQRRRQALLKQLDQRERRLRDELTGIAAARERALAREALRIEGQEIFARLHELPPDARDDAKERASKLFARYKKLGAALPHLERREHELGAQAGILDALRWEAERVAPEDLDELESTVTQLSGRRASRPAPPPRKRKRALLEVRTSGGSRIVVGRSPEENAHVTFTLARPHDLWFHAKDIPGAHVILARDDRLEPPLEDIETAASLAAAHSKAKSSAKVPVDYTLRKHVRKQRNAPPGLVWYTNPKTVIAEPRTGDAAAAEG
jgi:predicted ribosome quality control (RQC) complex YloA/Tae2 family protein